MCRRRFPGILEYQPGGPAGDAWVANNRDTAVAAFDPVSGAPGTRGATADAAVAGRDTGHCHVVSSTGPRCASLRPVYAVVAGPALG